MSKSLFQTGKIIERIESVQSLEEFAKHEKVIAKDESELDDSEKYSLQSSAEGLSQRIEFLKNKGIDCPNLFTDQNGMDPANLKGNIENYIGMAAIPVGLAGPLRVKGTMAEGEYLIPLATTEGALVASYNRGMKVCRLAGGITSVCLNESVQRSPLFKFRNIVTAGLFIKWVHEQSDKFEAIVGETSRFAKLNDITANIEGNTVILTFNYFTGDAAGQNMVTICTNMICKYILENCEIKPDEWYIESNHSGDKKATLNSFINVRGKKVTSEIFIPEELVKSVLKTTPEKMAHYWQSSTLAAVQSGAIGAQGHVANGLTALFIACGQDVACIAESSVGVTRMEVSDQNELYASVTLPSLIVGTVGGGTGLPTQKECLSMMDCAGAGNARKFAEICGAVALAGEISIAAAMSVDHFTRAHELLGRK